MPRDFDLLRKILVWVSFAVLPLTLDELLEAIAIEPDSPDIDDECRLCSSQEILKLAHSFVSVTSDGHVRLAHLSIRDYLCDSTRQHPQLSKFTLEPSQAHDELALDCLTYLKFRDLQKGPKTTQEDFLGRLEKLPLLRYAAMAWSYHARASTPDNKLQQMSIDFFKPASRPQFLSWVQIINADSNFKWNVYPHHATSLYYASSFGLTAVVQSLLVSQNCEDINAPGSRFGGTALHAAAIRQHTYIMEMLLEAGARPGQGDLNGVTPLHSAASQGNMKVVQLLLKHGAPLDARDSMNGETPEEWAKRSAQNDMVEYLVTVKSPNFELFHDKPDDSPHPCPEPLVWRPGPGYFPDFYEKRSGLTSSLLVS